METYSISKGILESEWVRSIFERKFNLDRHIDRRREAMSKAFEADKNKLMRALSEFPEDEMITVRHCCTYGGGGYYTLYSENRKNFVKSDFELEILGGVWSEYVYFRLYAGQKRLNEFLLKLRSEVEKDSRVCMQIRQLYAYFILDGAADCFKDKENSSYPEIQSAIGKAYVTELIKAYCNEYNDEINRFRAFRKDFDNKNGLLWYEYYNEGCTEYNIVPFIIQSSIDEIYKHRSELEKCGLWEKVHSIQGEMFDLIREYYREQGKDIQ